MWIAQDFDTNRPLAIGGDLPVYHTRTRAVRAGVVTGIAGDLAQVNIGGRVVSVRVADAHVSMIAGAL